MNKKLLLVLAAAALSATSMQASFFDKFKASAKEGLKKYMPDIKKQVEAQTGVKVAGKKSDKTTQIRNKGSRIWIAFSTDGQFPGAQAKIYEIPEGTAQSPVTKVELPVDISKKTGIYVWTSAPDNRNADLYYEAPENKTLYLTWDGQELRGQTGKFLGALGGTTVGHYSLENNVRGNDLKKATAPTLPTKLEVAQA